MAALLLLFGINSLVVCHVYIPPKFFTSPMICASEHKVSNQLDLFDHLGK